MHSSQPNARELALLLHQARLEGREVPRLTEKHPGLTADEAYAVQEQGIALRLEAGERVIAYKMGLTSKAKREQMGLNEAIYGVLTDRMQLSPGEPYRMHGQIHPKAEPEIAVRISRRLGHLPQGPALTPDEAWEAVSEVAPAIEVLDSRYVGFKYFSLPDVIADNASSSQFLIGNRVPRPAHWRELEDWRLTLKTDGSTLHVALGREISGSPIQSLIEQVALLSARGEALPAGSWVLLGAATAAVPLAPGLEVTLDLASASWSQSLTLRVAPG